MVAQTYLLFITMVVIIVVAVIALFLFYKETRRSTIKPVRQNLREEPMQPSLAGVVKKEELVPLPAAVVKKEEMTPSPTAMNKPKDEIKPVLETGGQTPAAVPQAQGGKGLPQEVAATPARLEAKALEPSDKKETPVAAKAPEPSMKKEAPVDAKKQYDVMKIFTSEEGEGRPMGNLAAGLEDINISDILEDCRGIAGRLKKAR